MINYFKKEELSCPCCGIYNVNTLHLHLLNTARDNAGIAFTINSCCRCTAHNIAVGGNELSSHLTTDESPCLATDIKVPSSPNRYIIVNALLKAGFRRIGIAKTFIHADMDLNKPQEVIWMY